MAGFSSTGIFPLNRNIFTDEDILAASVTDRPAADINKNRLYPTLHFIAMEDTSACSVEEYLHDQPDHAILQHDSSSSSPPAEAVCQNSAPISSNSPSKMLCQTSASSAFGLSSETVYHSSAGTTAHSALSAVPLLQPTTSALDEVGEGYISPYKLFTLQKARLQKSKPKQVRKGQSRVLLLSTPEKRRLEEQLALKRQKNESKKSKIRKGKRERLVKKQFVRKKNVVFSDSCDESVRPFAKALQDNFEVHSSDELIESDSDVGISATNLVQVDVQWSCCICGEDFNNSKPKEKWVRCTCKGCVSCIPGNKSSCSKSFGQNWAHSLCTNNPQQFVCVKC